MRVLVATDRASLGAALTLFLSGSDVEVIGVVGHAGDVLASAVATRPDVVLVDCRLADGSEGGLVTELKRRACDLCVIVLGTEDDVSAGRSDADGFAAVGDSPDSLLALMRTVTADSR